MLRTKSWRNLLIMCFKYVCKQTQRLTPAVVSPRLQSLAHELSAVGTIDACEQYQHGDDKVGAPWWVPSKGECSAYNHAGGLLSPL